MKKHFDKIIDFWYDTKRGIKNLIMWFPAIWKDRQWDHQYIYMILRQKLHFQEQYIREHGIHVHNVRDADEIKICVDCLDRLIEDDYHSEAFKKHNKRWGEPEFKWEDVPPEKVEGRVGMTKLNITHPLVDTVQDHENEREDFRDACETEDQLRKKDMRNLFLNMYRNIQGWWD
jgi:hypothetical protein